MKTKNLKESTTEIKNLIKRAPKPETKPIVKPQASLDVDNYDCPKVKCIKCGVDCLDDSHVYDLDIPTELRAWDTVFGWYCDKCHDTQSDYEWNLESFCLACEDSDIIRNRLYEDTGIDELANMIDSWNQAKKDPRFMLASEASRMEQNFISNAKDCELDIDPNVFTLNTVNSTDLGESSVAIPQRDWKARTKSFLDNDLFVDFDEPTENSTNSTLKEANIDEKIYVIFNYGTPKNLDNYYLLAVCKSRLETIKELTEIARYRVQEFGNVKNTLVCYLINPADYDCTADEFVQAAAKYSDGQDLHWFHTNIVYALSSMVEHAKPLYKLSMTDIEVEFYEDFIAKSSTSITIADLYDDEYSYPVLNQAVISKINTDPTFIKFVDTKLAAAINKAL